MHVLDIKYTGAIFIGFTLVLGFHELGDDNLMLKFFFPDEVKVDITIVDIRLKSNSTTSKTTRFTKTSFFSIRNNVLHNPIKNLKAIL